MGIISLANIIMLHLTILVNPLSSFFQRAFKRQWKLIQKSEQTHFESAPAHEATVCATFHAQLAPPPLAH